MTRIYLTMAAVFLIGLSLALIIAEPLSADGQRTPAAFRFQASETAGGVVLEWNPDSPLIREATSGRLQFVDGGLTHSDQVDVRVLRQGGLEYRRRSTDVILRLSLLKGNTVIGHSSVRLTGPASLTPESAR